MQAWMLLSAAARQTLNCCSSFKLWSIALTLSAAWRISTKTLITISLQGKWAPHFNVKPGRLFCGKCHSHHFLFCVNVEVWNTPYDDDDTHETRRSYMTDSHLPNAHAASSPPPPAPAPAERDSGAPPPPPRAFGVESYMSSAAVSVFSNLERKSRSTVWLRQDEFVVSCRVGRHSASGTL